MTISVNEELAKAYVEAAGICAVVVTRKPATEISRLTTRSVVDFSALQVARRAAEGKVDYFLWCRDKEAADRLVRATVEELIARQVHGRGRRIQLAAEKLFAIVQEVAHRTAERVTPHERVVARALSVVGEVNAAYAPGSGQLRALNRAYRAHRIAESSRGRKAVGYSEWLSEHKTATLASLARAQNRK